MLERLENFLRLGILIVGGGEGMDGRVFYLGFYFVLGR